MTLTIPKDMLDLELRDPAKSEYGFKGYYPVLETHLMWYNEIGDRWRIAEWVKVSKNLSGWYYFGSLPINNEAAMVQHLINLKRQIDDSVLYIKETKVNNKLKKIKEDF